MIKTLKVYPLGDFRQKAGFIDILDAKWNHICCIIAIKHNDSKEEIKKYNITKETVIYDESNLPDIYIDSESISKSEIKKGIKLLNYESKHRYELVLKNICKIQRETKFKLKDIYYASKFENNPLEKIMTYHKKGFKYNSINKHISKYTKEDKLENKEIEKYYSNISSLIKKYDFSIREKQFFQRIFLNKINSTTNGNFDYKIIILKRLTFDLNNALKKVKK